MTHKPKHSNTFHYILTFVSILLLFGSFATHLFTGKAPLLIMDSHAGSVLIGIILVLYLFWFIYDYSTAETIPLSQAAGQMLKSSAVAWCVYAFWVVFIIIPLIVNML